MDIIIPPDSSSSQEMENEKLKELLEESEEANNTFDTKLKKQIKEQKKTRDEK